MAQRLSEQVVEWLTVGGDAFTPQNSNSIPLVVSKPGQTVTIPATNGTAIGIYNNQGQLWTVGAAGATSSVKSSQLIVSSSDAAAGAGAALELWRGTDVSWQLRADNSTDTLIIANNWTTAAQTSYTSNVSFGYGTVANQYVHIYSTLDSNYSYGGASGSALSVAGGITANKKIYFADTTDSNYATKAGALVVEGGVNIAKKVYLRDTTDSNYATVAGSFVTMGGAYIKKKTYIADTTDSSSTSTGSFSTAGGASVAKKLYVGSDFNQTGDTAQIASNNIVFRNKSKNNSQAGSYPYITGLTIGDSSEVTLDEYKDGYLSIHSKSGLLIYPTNSARPAVYDATKTYSVGTIVWYSNDYYRCTTAITEAQEWTAANWTKLPIAAGAMWVHGNVNPTITNTYTLGTTSCRWSKLYIGTADSYGSGTQPIYWNAGVPTASTSTVGSGIKPIYLSSGTLTVSSSTVGSGVIPMYLSSGTLTASSSTVGSGVKPIYLSSGTLTVSSSTVGTATKPVYLSSGTITVGTYELKATINNATQWGVAYYSTTTNVTSTAAGTAGYPLIGAGSAAPAWYGGTVFSGTAAASWVTTLSGTTDIAAADSTTRSGSLITTGGIHIDKGLKVGKWTNTSTAIGVGIRVHDLRNVAVTGNLFGDQAVNWYFKQINSSWASSMHIKGWTGSYYSWEIAGNAHNSSVDKYYVRTNSNTAEGTWHTLVYLPAFAAIGSSTGPVYVNASGQVTACGSSLAVSITGSSASCTGNAASATKVGIAGIWLYPNNNNEINFGGTNTSTSIYFGYRATDSRPKPTDFIFGSGSGTANIKAAVYVTSNHGTGNPGSSTAGNGVTGALYFKRI